MRKPAFCICKNKDADQLRGNHEADQRLCFRYTDSSILILPKLKFQASSYNPLWLHSVVCVGPGRKPRRLVFSQRGSNVTLNKYFAVDSGEPVPPCSRCNSYILPCINHPLSYFNICASL